MYNTLFLGQNLIADNCVKILLDSNTLSNICLKAIVSNEKDYTSWVEKYNKTDIIFISNRNRNEFNIQEQIEKLSINLIISVQHPWILSKSILESVNHFAFNLHNAKLPDYKGYNSISHAILNGEKVYTTTIHWMCPTVDMGDIAYEKSVIINDDDTAISLYKRSVEAAKSNFQMLINDLNIGNTIPKKPINTEGTFYGKNDIISLKRIKSITDFQEVDRKSRAFYFPPHEPAYFLLDKIKFYVSRHSY